MEQRAALPLDETADAISGWLLAHAQHSGAVAGTVGDDGRPDYLYPETGGYHLSWLGFIATVRPDLRPAAARAAEGVAGWIARLDPFTGRVPLRGQFDWRAEATFAFDLSIVAAGLEAAAPLVSAQTLAASREKVWSVLELHCGGDLRPCIARGDSRLPKQWSTRRGPYQLKPAALLARCSAVPSRIRAAAASTVARWRDSVSIQGPVHPLLYAGEGLFLLGDADAAARVVRGVLQLQRPDGSLPEFVEDPSSRARSDVLAQALRLAASLGEGARARLDALEAALNRHVSPSGAVRFREGEPGANVWCAQFAHQALSVRAGAPLQPLV